MQNSDQRIKIIKKIRFKILAGAIILILIFNFMLNTSQDAARRVENIATPKAVEVIKEVEVFVPQEKYFWSCAYFGIKLRDIAWLTMTLIVIALIYLNSKHKWLLLRK